tara:strand:+ start:275 stop:898 length:624 start_codon:yes stop_codon:yes gene_type:complete
MKKLLGIVVLGFFFSVNAYSNNINFKCSIDYQSRGYSLKNEVKWYNLFKEKFYYNFENNRLKKVGENKNNLRLIDWSTNFRDDPEDNDWTYVEGIFATKNLQIISYQIRYSKSYPDIASHFSNMYDLKIDAFDDWKKNNDSSYEYFESWLKNYPKKKEKYMRLNVDNYIASFLTGEMRKKEIESLISRTNFSPIQNKLYTNGECSPY